MTESRAAEARPGGSGRPKVSVVISAFNKQDYIAHAVTSVLAQTEPAVEVIVVDDVSTDATRDVVRGLMARDARVRLIALERNVGQPAVLNIGMAHARGDWVAILDGDDWVAPGLYAGLLDLAARHGAAVLASDMQWVDEGGRTDPWRRLLLPGTNQPLVLGAEAFIRRSMPYQLRPLSFLQPMFRRDLVERGLRYDETDRFDLDFAILVRAILLGGPLVISPVPGYYYRQLSGSMISSRGPATLRRMKGSNDALLPDCLRHRATAAAALIRKRSRAVAREIARAEVVAAVRSRSWQQVALGLALSPGDGMALAWRRVRGPLYWTWRRWHVQMRMRTASHRAAVGVVTAELSWQAEAVLGPWATASLAMI
jgi:succinoglycan biosynthesis protein ExoO